jgi:general secretion pathway protein L
VSSGLRDRFGRQVARWTGTGGFFAWWGRSLAGWLPRRWRLALGLDRGRLLLQPDADAVQLRLQDGDGVRDLAHVPGLAAADGDALAALLSPELADLPRWLLLPAAAGLRRRLFLPAAAAERLRDVVGFEIDRQTPFAPDAVAFDARLLGRRDSDGQLDTELVVVPREALSAQLDALGPLAGSLAGIDVAGGDGTPLGVNLLPLAQRRQQLDPWRGWNWVFGAVALLAIAMMLWQLLDNRDRAAQALQARADREAVAARAVSLQRQQLVDLVEGRAFLDRLRNARPTAIEVLDALARRLPDNTYLEKLAIENDRLLLIGLSSEASALVGRLEGARPWRSPALTGALQPDPRSGRDRFTLTADLTIAPAAPATAPASPEPADAGND